MTRSNVEAFARQEPAGMRTHEHHLSIDELEALIERLDVLASHRESEFERFGLTELAHALRNMAAAAKLMVHAEHRRLH
jgi:hypothetical protein